jgi:hypothetical protein
MADQWMWIVALIVALAVALWVVWRFSGHSDSVNLEARRNAQCPCGSGKKYKRCCLDSDREIRVRARSIGPPDDRTAI